MGNLIENLKKSKPDFRSELDTYIQQVKLENREELSNLHSTIASLREQLENSKFVTGELVQNVVPIKVTKLINLNQQSQN